MSPAERESVVARMVAAQPTLSDRSIASSTGVAARTVAAIRRRSVDQTSHSAVRVGKDGRVRPLNSAEGRRKAGEVFARHPGATLRQAAEAAGISVGTARDVRDRLRRGEDPVPEGMRSRSEPATVRELVPRCALPPRREEADAARLLEGLRRDPAVNLTEAGRALLRLLTLHAVSHTNQKDLVEALPPHCFPLVARLASSCAESWTRLATDFERRAAGIA
ncbi:streptomycin biosynthesis regulator [Lentzea sp. JNUCC 0626]|uniref:streptomycin biosynthesis regulator n=1 Tax=Lentzea sp. JNUCC 0626 TaxID=3367513 RepID=UPI003748428D